MTVEDAITLFPECQELERSCTLSEESKMRAVLRNRGLRCPTATDFIFLSLDVYRTLAEAFMSGFVRDQWDDR